MNSIYSSTDPEVIGHQEWAARAVACARELGFFAEREQEAAERMPEESFPWSIKQISSALKSTINDHGDITRTSTFSAAKRIVSQLYGATAPAQYAARLEGYERRERELLERIRVLEKS